MAAVRAGKLAHLRSDVKADVEITRRSVPASGGLDVDTTALDDGGRLFRETSELIADLTAGHAKTKVLFARAEDCYRSVLAHPQSAIAQQARIEMERLNALWTTKLRAELITHLEARAINVERVRSTEAKRRVAAVIERLNTHFDARYGFTAYASRQHFADPDAFRAAVRKYLAESGTFTSAETLEELSDLSRHLPFFKRTPAPAQPRKRHGSELVTGLRGLSGPNDPINALQALETLFREGHRLYDDVADVIDRRVAADLAGTASPSDPVVLDLVDKIQGRVAEAIALAQPGFQKRVWEPATRTAEELRRLLNETDLSGLPAKQQWRVQVITEPVIATTASGKAGELLDSGIWLVRDTPTGGFAMPVFALEVKSGELRESITQQMLGRERLTGGVMRLSSGQTYQIQPTRVVEMASALASTRPVSDKRILGLLRRGEKMGLAPGTSLLTVKLTMSRGDIRAAALAMVVTRLRQLNKLRE